MELVGLMAERYVKIRYRGSSLGVFWSLLNPLAMTSIYALVFGHAFGHYYGPSVFDYLFAVFIGFVTINYFSSSSAQALQSIVNNGLLLNKMRVPPSIFPVATVAANSIQFVWTVVPLLALLTLIIGRNPLGLPLLIFPLAGLLMVTLGVSLITAAAHVYYRDVPHIYDLINFVIFVGTPVFYPLGIVSATARPLIQWTPISLIVEELRAIVILHRVPTLASFLVMGLWAVVVLAMGRLVFVAASRNFMDRL